ncbi:AzlC family ABC transporter permease [Actinosynnema sp.]|uniref:AzlC family ABC transporter permease n=1 Tax=Actinosynnema sp. TaxID=1872144 RepID=UPI003F83136D
MLPAALGAVPLGLAFGVLVTHTGLAWWWGTVFASVVFAGSFEFLLLGLVMAVAPLSQIAVTAFLVNFRHVFYALSFPLHRVRGAGAKVYSTFALTDEAWALTASPEARGWSRGRILAIQGGFHVVWVASVTAGGLVGNLVPEGVHGLGFALTALFLVLGIDAYRVRRKLPAPIAAVVCAVVSGAVFGEGMLVGAMGLFTGYLVVTFLVERRRGQRGRQRGGQRGGRRA